MQIAKLSFAVVAFTALFAVTFSQTTPYTGGGGPGGYMAFILSPQVAYGALSPTALVGIVGYLGAGRIDLVLSDFYGNAVKSPQLLQQAKNQANWVVGAGICQQNGANCQRRQLGLAVTDMIKEELEGQGLMNTFMMKSSGGLNDNDDYYNPSKARFGKMTKSFLSTETYNRLKQYESLSSIQTSEIKDRPTAFIKQSGGNTVCNVCGIKGEILMEDGETCVVRENCDVSDNLPNPNGGIELPRVSLMSFTLDAACKAEDGVTACLNEATIKATMLDTFGSTARISVAEGSNFDMEDLYDPIDRENMMREENARRLQNLVLDVDQSLEQCSVHSTYIVSAVFMDDEEFKTARKEMGSETVEDDIATFLSVDHDNLCGIKVTPKFAYHIPAPNDPAFNKAVRPLEASMSIPTIQVASDENGHENILVRGETYRVVMDDFKTGETVTVHLVKVNDDDSSEEVRTLKSIQNFSSDMGPIEFDWTVGDLQPIGSYYFEVTIKDTPVSYSSAFEILA
jgi:hypothetical protein